MLDLSIRRSAFFLLIKTKPGREAQVLKRLRKGAVELGVDKDVKLLVAFGEFDVIAVVTGEPARAALLRIGTIPHVLSTREVRCFGLVPDVAPDVATEPPSPASKSERLDRHMYCLTFVRLPCFFLRADADEPERDFLDWWYDDGQAELRADVALFGAMGGPEFVLLGTGSDWEPLSVRLKALGRAEHRIEKTFSILAVSERILEDGEARPKLGICPQGLSVEMRLSARPRHWNEALEGAISTMELRVRATPHRSGDDVRGTASAWSEEDMELVFAGLRPGTEDCTLIIDPGPRTEVAQLLVRILKFREEWKHALLDTVTNLQFSLLGESLARPPSTEDRDDPRFAIPQLILEPETARILANLPKAGGMLVRSAYSLNNILQNPLVSAELLDVVLYYYAMLREAEAYDPDDAPTRRLQDLLERLASGHLGVNQRTNGSLSGISPIEGSVRFLIGGIQRVMFAAEAVPQSIFEQAKNEPWGGFVLVGAEGLQWTLHYQVLHLPLDLTNEPQFWYFLVHESVHCLTSSKAQTFSAKGGAFQDVYDDIRQAVADYELEDIDFHASVAREVVVDAIEANLSPFWDSELVSSGHWHAFDRVEDLRHLDEGRRVSLVVRDVLLRLACRVQLSDDVDPPDRLLEDCIGAARRGGERIGGDLGEKVRHVLANVSDATVLAACRTMLPAVWFAVEHRVIRDPERLRERQRWWEREPDGLQPSRARLINDVRAGRYDFERMGTTPELFVWSLFDAFGREASQGGADDQADDLERAGVAAMTRLAAWHRNRANQWRDEVLAKRTPGRAAR